MKDRIKHFIESKGISAGELAAVLEVQRSNISHILNGRNKPGASFIEKLLLEFPDLNARWLLTGEGGMFEDQNSSEITPRQKQPITEEPIKEQASRANSIENNVVPGKIIERSSQSSNSEIDKMVIIYGDGTFNVYKQR